MSDEAIVSLVFSSLSLVGTILTYTYTKNFNESQKIITEKNNLNNFINKFKEELNQFRLGLTEIISIKKVILVHEKDNYLYLIESKYSISELKKSLGKDFYNDFLSLKLIIDGSLDDIIYQSNYEKAKISLENIRFLYEKINSKFDEVNYS